VTQKPEGIDVHPQLFMATALSFLQGLVFLSGYISNNVFPQPLNEADESSCLQRLKQGDEEAPNELIEHNLRLVAHIIKRLCARYGIIQVSLSEPV
jgi:RNA polymerase sporulation-specific sigma factor